MNFLIEGDNLASLKLLEKTHKGKIDVIYIDPPYNTRKRDWKYDNDIVDPNDTFIHSKWLSFMERRLTIARRLLSKDGLLICTIDKWEQENLGVLLEQLFTDKEIVCVTILHNPGGTQGNNFSYSNEFAYFLFPKTDDKKVYISSLQRDNTDETAFRDWGKASALRTAGKTCFYPIYIENNEIVGVGEVCKDEFHPASANVILEDGRIAVYPIDTNGTEMKWRFGLDTVGEIIDELFAKESKGLYSIFRKKTNFHYKTVWTNVKFNANVYGTKLLGKILTEKFPFPKSLYAVEECIRACIHNKNNATILDFFAGSGTTGHAVLELNKEDGGKRKFILCTNNENKICEEVTYQRIKTVITGKRKDGSEYGQGIAGSLKYFKIDFTPITDKLYYEYADKLLLHIKELVELENAVDFDRNDKIDILLDEDQANKFFADAKRTDRVKTIYLGHDLSLTLAQKRTATERGIKINIIPEYYYKEKQ